MKIITNDGIYVQFIDLYYLSKIKTSKLILNLNSFFIKELNKINEKNKYTFIKFRTDNDINYINSFDWLIDFDEITKLSEDEIIKICNDKIYERNYLADKYNILSMKGRKKSNNILEKCTILEYEINNYSNILNIKKRKLKIELPENIEFPNDFFEDKKERKLIKIFSLNKK